MKNLDIKWEDAPHWADRLMECRFVKYWCSVDRYTEVGLNKDSYLFKIGGVTIGHLSLIEMRPDQPTKSDEWVPAVGEECEVNIGATDVFELATIRYISGQIVISDVGGHEFSSQASITKFRKPKTQQEKDREAFIEKAKLILDKHGDHGHKAFFGAMFDDGFTAPEGEA